MKRLSLAILFAFPALAFAVPPQISDVAFGQITSGKRTVTVRYLLTGAPAVVTMDVQTNGVSIGAANVRYLSGDVNRAVQPDAQNLKTILWDAERSWPGQQIKDNSVTVKLTAWSLDGPPPYMLVTSPGRMGSATMRRPTTCRSVSWKATSTAPTTCCCAASTPPASCGRWVTPRKPATRTTVTPATT